jgi:hypothetical protein
MVLLEGPTELRFFMSEVTLYPAARPRQQDEELAVRDVCSKANNQHLYQ